MTISLSRFTSLFLGVMALAPFSIPDAKAQESVSKSIGVFGVQIPGASVEHPLRRTHLGTHLESPPVYSGSVSGVSGKVIVPTASGFGGPGMELPPQNTSPPEKYYLHFTFGNARGYIADVASFANDEIHCEEDLPSFVQEGDYFFISRHRRLSEIFTSDNSYGFGDGESAAQSDVVAIFNPALQTEELFYFHSVRQRWEKEGVPGNANDHFIRYPYGFYVIRRTTGMIRILLKGFVPEEPLLLPVQTGLNLFSLPVGNATSISHLIKVGGAHSAQGGPNAITSDLFYLHEASGSDERGPFYSSTASATPKWLKVGESGSSESATVVDPLSSLLIHRKGSPGFLFVESDQYTPPPYFSLAANPEPDEVPIWTIIQFTVPGPANPGVTASLWMSTDLMNWSEINDDIFPSGNMIISAVEVPAGQSRRYYRIHVNISN